MGGSRLKADCHIVLLGPDLIVLVVKAFKIEYQYRQDCPEDVVIAVVAFSLSKE